MGMKKESKKAKKKSKKEEDAADVEEDLADAPDFDVDGNNNNSSDDEHEESKKRSKKKKSKSSKKRPLEDADNVDDGDDTAASKSSSKVDRATRKAAKKEQKEALMAKIPKLDPDGIPYNKIQIRRMLRRVKHGLDPVATEEEEKEIREREKREKAEEERLLFAERNDEEDKQEDNDYNKDNNEADETKSDQEDEEEEAAPATKEPAQETPRKKSHNPPSKKTKRSKPVPPDYICQACQNNLPKFTPHWIYDCPNKVTQRGCNTVSKKLRGLHDPPSRKVFVSGLPFECTEGHVKRYFEQNMDGADAAESIALVHCKLLKFEDSSRCKGQGILTFESDLGAQLALKLNGSTWEDVEEPGVAMKKKKKGGAKESGDKKKELKLKVTKVLNRHVTKKKFGK